MCWYCYWGWPEPVANIYKQALAKLGDYERPLHYGPSHIVWEDCNFENGNIQYCLDNLQTHRNDCADEELAIVRWSLEELLKIPEEIRDPCPDGYDHNGDPAKFPPPGNIKMVKV